MASIAALKRAANERKQRKAGPEIVELPDDAPNDKAKPKQNMVEMIDEAVYNIKVRIDPQWFAHYNHSFKIDNLTWIHHNTTFHMEGVMPFADQAFDGVKVEFRPDEGTDKSKPLSAHSFVGMVPVGMITDRTRLYYWDTDKFSPYELFDATDDEEKKQFELIKARIVAYNWNWNGWYVSPLFNSDDVFNHGYCGSLLALPGTYDELKTVVRESNFVQTLDEYVAFAAKIGEVFRSRANCSVLILPKTKALMLVTNKEVEPCTALTSTLLVSDTYFAILYADPLTGDERDAADQFVGRVWKYENEMNNKKKAEAEAAKSNADAKPVDAPPIESASSVSVATVTSGAPVSKQQDEKV